MLSLIVFRPSSYDYIVPKADSPPRRKKPRAHIFERRRSKAASSDKTPKMSLREALARLSGRDFVPVKKNFWTRIAELERVLRSPDSIYACKTAAAVAVFAVFLLAPSLHVRPFVAAISSLRWAISSKLMQFSSDLLHKLWLDGRNHHDRCVDRCRLAVQSRSPCTGAVVAVSPTLGQSLVTFFLQIMGTGMGSLIGLLMLRIFLDVGGYKFNPYGLASLCFVFGLPLSAVIYVKPMFFAGALLAMNSAGTLIVTECVRERLPFATC